MYPVIDLKRAKSFYEANLGLKPNKISANGSWVKYDLPGGGCFAITTLAQGVSPSENAGGSVAFEVEDLDAMVEKLKSNDVKFKLDTFQFPVCKMAVIVDSEGNAITLHQLTKK